MSPPRQTVIALACGLWCWAGSPTEARAQPARHGRVSPTELAVQIDQISGQVKNAETNLRIVETQYTERPELTPDESSAKRFSDGEIQYLLGSWQQASVLFYDLVSDPEFQKSSRYADALFYLADSLRQQKNFVGAQLYWKQLLALGPSASHYRDGLERFLETAGQLNEFEGVDGYVEAARKEGSALPPELSYVYGKWLFKRADLPLEDRLARAEKVFQELAADPRGGLKLQAEYFLAVIAVQRAHGDDKEGHKDGYKEGYGQAIRRFQALLAEKPKDPTEEKIHELANLSLGRLFYEAGRYDEALDQYQEIPRESDNFVDSLYEIAWVQVKKGEWQKAKDATDIVLLAAPESTLAPEAKLLQGHLLLKLKKYEDASETYDSVINNYAPVRDEIDALLTVNKDPVTYFDHLLARNDKNLDVGSLLPPVALKWATTQKEVAQAMGIVNDLELGRHGVAESNDIAEHILAALEQRGLEAFPVIQAGYTQADAVDTALTTSEQALMRIEGYLVEDALTPEERQTYEQARASVDELRRRFESLPKDPAEVEARKKRLQARVDEVDRAAFKLGYELQSQYAILTAMEKWVEDTRADRKNSPEDEKAFLDQLRLERAGLDAQAQALEELRKQLAAERETADAAISGEDVIRAQYEAELDKQHALIRAAEERLGADAARTLEKAHQARARIAELRARTNKAKDVLRAQLDTKGKQIRQKIRNEQALLATYGKDVSSVSGDARGLVGRIAFDSFKRVRKQFYDLVLKADVGLVDVAFTRKQDQTAEIQKLAAEKDHELKQLDDEFKEVLKDVD